MERNRMTTAVQKAYDDTYLSCSTAVFHESQGNEVEATRYWKSALDRIRDHHTRYPKSSIQSTQDEAEKALLEALKELELQCRERIDILEALKASRRSIHHAETAVSTAAGAASPFSGSRFIGQGTIPAVTYSQLPRPVLPSPRSRSPQRPSDNFQIGVDIAGAVYRHGSISTSSSPHHGSKEGKMSRALSPEKHSMRMTLRSGKGAEKLNKSIVKISKPNGEGSSRAATLAWNTFELRDSVHHPSIHDASSPLDLSPRQLAEHILKSQSSPAHWNSHSRRFASSSEKDSSSKTTRTPIISRHFSAYSSSQPSLLSVSAATNAPGTIANSESFTPDKMHRSSGRYSTSQRTTPCSTTPTPCGGHSDSVKDENQTKDGKIQNNIDHATSERRNPLLIALGRDVTRDRVSNSSSPDLAESSSHHGRVRSDQSPKSKYPQLSPPSVNPEGGSQPHRNRKSRYSVDSCSRGKGQQGVLSAKDPTKTSWVKKKSEILKNLPSGIDEAAARQILNDIVVQGDEVHWGDIAGLEIAKNALRETIVYPFLRPDLFMGLREPARGMLLFGPPGTGKTMLARAVATESRSTFFSISASSLTSKYLGESEKLVKALFTLARALAPSIIFVDEIDSLLTQRSGSGEHEATRRIKTEFLIQWSDLQRAAAGRELTERDKKRGDANRVLVLAATNLPWAIDEAARRRFVRRQYIPLPEPATRRTQLRTLLGQQKHMLSADDLSKLVQLTDGFSGSDITALAKDAAMGPLRSLGEALLHTSTEEIRPIQFADFEASLGAIRPSVNKKGLEKYEDWAKEFGERGG